ncbi:MAG: hypothetical protein KAG66_06700, partial [Methylococcales bacterium]|nr:hypothetical protein [Methylococcales bacterium]
LYEGNAISNTSRVTKVAREAIKASTALVTGTTPKDISTLIDKAKEGEVVTNKMVQDVVKHEADKASGVDVKVRAKASTLLNAYGFDKGTHAEKMFHEAIETSDASPLAIKEAMVQARVDANNEVEFITDNIEAMMTAQGKEGGIEAHPAMGKLIESVKRGNEVAVADIEKSLVQAPVSQATANTAESTPLSQPTPAMGQPTTTTTKSEPAASKGHLSLLLERDGRSLGEGKLKVHADIASGKVTTAEQVIKGIQQVAKGITKSTEAVATQGSKLLTEAGIKSGTSPKVDALIKRASKGDAVTPAMLKQAVKESIATTPANNNTDAQRTDDGSVINTGSTTTKSTKTKSATKQSKAKAAAKALAKEV